MLEMEVLQNIETLVKRRKHVSLPETPKTHLPFFHSPLGGWSVSCRIWGGGVQRILPVSMGSGPAPAAKGPWESSGTQALCAAAAATASAGGAVWEQKTGSAPCAMLTGRDGPQRPLSLWQIVCKKNLKISSVPPAITAGIWIPLPRFFSKSI